jgi:hypothetical protein
MFLAFAEEANTVNVDMVNDVIGDLDFENYHWTEEPDAAPLTPLASPVVAALVTPLPVTSVPDVDLHRILADISKRIESVEHNIAAPLHTVLKEQSDRFTSFQSTVASHTAKTNSHIHDLSRKLEELSSAVSRKTLEQSIPDDSSKTSFVRRVFGGTSQPAKK